MLSRPKNIVVTGSSGQLGMEFQLLTLLYPDFQFHFYSKSEWNIEDRLKAEEILQTLQPYCLINCAAYTQVEKAEDEPALAYRINGDACETLALACNKYNVLLVHLSTDYVFDGGQTTPYSETSATHPLNVYGKSKRMGEEKIEFHAAQFIILRTSWLYSSFGHNFF
jgi:dTDP-4-dehydrorhamnose reductase